MRTDVATLLFAIAAASSAHAAPASKQTIDRLQILSRGAAQLAFGMSNALAATSDQNDGLGRTCRHEVELQAFLASDALHGLPPVLVMRRLVYGENADLADQLVQNQAQEAMSTLTLIGGRLAEVRSLCGRVPGVSVAIESLLGTVSEGKEVVRPLAAP